MRILNTFLEEFLCKMEQGNFRKVQHFRIIQFALNSGIE